MEKHDYSKVDIINALKEVGISNGNSIFIHSNIGFFGKLLDGNDNKSYWKIYKESIFHVLGQEGTLIVPTFTYSFCWNNIYNKNQTPSTTGIFSEFVRLDPQSLRSDDANFSVAAIGKNAEFFTKDASTHSFSKNSFWERFLKNNGKICCFNVGIKYNTFIHYVEKELQVPYRMDKKFTGISIIDGKEQKREFIHFVRDLSNPKLEPDLTEFVIMAKNEGMVREASLGRGIVSCISARDTYELIKRELQKNPKFLIKGERG